jgi:predicted nucleotidyltransferase
MSTTLSPVQERALDAVRRIVTEHLRDLPEARAWLFGSFARGEQRQWSDIDVAIDNAGDRVPVRLMTSLRVALEESSVPWFVDVVDLATAGQEYRREVEREGVLWRGRP